MKLFQLFIAGAVASATLGAAPSSAQRFIPGLNPVVTLAQSAAKPADKPTTNPPGGPGPTFPLPDPCAPRDPNCGPIPTDPKQPVPMMKKAIKPMILGRKQ